MKTKLLLFVMTMMSIASFGQTKAAARAATNSDEIPWAYYLQDKTKGYRIGMNATGEYSAAMFVPGDGILKGTKVTSIGIPSVIEGMKDVKVWIRDSIAGADIVSATIPSIEKGTYGKVSLNQEYEIPEKGFYVGYTFNSPDMYPILFSGDHHEEACWIKCPNEEWEDLYESGYGSISIQVYVTGKEYPQNSLSLRLPKNSIILKAGGEAEITQYISSNNSNDITSYKMGIDNGVHQFYQTVDLSGKPIKAGLGRVITKSCSFEVPNAISANNSVTFSIVEVNGEPNNSSNATATLKVRIGKEGGIRRSLVEENTGTGCGYCPISIASMETMKELYGDKFIGITLHQFNENDPMYLNPDNYYNLGLESAPMTTVDRYEEVYPSNLSQYFEEYNNIPPLANVNVEGYWNEDGTAVEVTSDIEILTNDLNMNVAYVLVADGLSKMDVKWCQYNFYDEDDPSYYANKWFYDNFKDFLSGGKYATNPILGLVFNDVAVSTSYVNQKTEIPTYSGISLGDKITNHYTLKLNASDDLKSAINPENTSIVVILEDEDGNIVNAAEAPVKSYSSGIESIIDNKANAKKIYTIGGKATTKCQKGINIIRMTDGTVKKVIQ